MRQRSPAPSRAATSTPRTRTRASGSTLSVDGRTFGETSGLSQVGQFTARFHDNTTMSVTANPAGEAAVQDALNCLLGKNLVTLSGFFLNEMPAFQVRTNAYQRDAEIFDLFGVTEPGDGNRYVKFTSQSTFDTAMLSVVDFGSFDGYHTVGIDVTGCANPGDCTSWCLEECDGPDDPLGCSCAGGGTCTIEMDTGATSDFAMVQTITG